VSEKEMNALNEEDLEDVAGGKIQASITGKGYDVVNADGTFLASGVRWSKAKRMEKSAVNEIRDVHIKRHR